MTLMPPAPTVLVIDDDVVLARAFVRALAGEGYRVHAVHSAEDALRELQADPPDVIILDFRMPRINGVGFLYRLRAQTAHHNTPVMVVTGDALLSDEVRGELRDLGAEMRLKPVSLEELVATTRLLVSRAPKPAAEHFDVSSKPA